MHIIYIRKKKLSFSPNHVAVSMGSGTNPGALSENTVVSFWPKALMKTHVEKQKEHKNAKISATATATATATVITVTTPGRRARARAKYFEKFKKSRMSTLRSRHRCFSAPRPWALCQTRVFLTKPQRKIFVCTSLSRDPIASSRVCSRFANFTEEKCRKWRRRYFRFLASCAPG